MIYILDNLDRELLLGAIAGPRFKEYFFANCKCDKIRAKIAELIGE